MRIDGRLLVVLPVTCVLVGCAVSHAPEPQGETTTFLVSDLTVPPVEEAGRLAGVDLDGVDSDGLDGSTCVDRNRDYVSLYDPSERGIDNRISDLIYRPLERPGTDPTATGLIARGQLALALRVSHVDSYIDDEAVEVQLGTAHVPGCDIAAPETCVPAFDGTMPSSAQPVVFEAIGASVSMRIVGGRLQGELGAVSVPAALFGATVEWAEYPLTVRDARIDAAVRQDALNGSLGGSLSVDELAEFAAVVNPTEDHEARRRQLGLDGDLDPSPSDPLLCAALSVGIQLFAVRVTPIE